MAEDKTPPGPILTPEEKRVFGQLFRQADTDGIGVVTGEAAVKFFENTSFDSLVLGEIWQIADPTNRGLLTPAGFGILMRLIGHYQAGRHPTPELALRPGPLPKLEKGSVSGPATSPTIQPPPGPPPSALRPQGSGSVPVRVPPLTPEKITQYSTLFERSGVQDGYLPGEQAKNIFTRANLPNEVLVGIWNLADTEQRGSLTLTEFLIAMHLLASFKSGTIRSLPNVIPAGLYEAAARRPQSRQPSGTMQSIPRQLSGAPTGRTGSPLGRPAYAAQQSPQYSGAAGNWAITPSDKAKYDGIFNTIDKTSKGFITGDEAVPLLIESKLPEEALATIWDLADINSTGRLSRDEFAVAMYLIRQQRLPGSGREPLPTSLPANLVPPSMRNQARPAAVPTAPAFAGPAPTLPKSAADDLFGLDAFSSPAPPPAQAPQSTGGSASFGTSNDPFSSSRGPLTPSSPTQSSPQTSTFIKAFAPSSSFGQSLTYNTTGGSNSSGPSQPRTFPPQTSATEDLLGDNDPEISKRLTNETTELANLSNQVGTLSKQMSDVQGQRATSQNELNEASSQKRDFEQRLAQLRSLYEQEAKDVRSLEDRLNTSRNETKKLQTEIAMVEGTFQDLQTQHRQTAAALQADQQENANLKERMRVVNAEIAQLKPVLEKLRSDARQQKGLVAINKKQLATNEGEREKLKTEAEELNRSIDEDTKTLAAAAKVQSPPQVASPAPSTMSANNPFFRRHGSSSEIPTSPFTSPHQQTDRSFEHVFGPSFGDAPVSKEAAPPTTFRQDSEVRSFSPQSTGASRPQTSNEASSPATSNREFPQATMPPPPPESRQMTSNNLPFPDHDDSVTSSRQVSAPNSRFGEGSTGADTPTNYMGTTPTGSSSAGPTETTRAISPGLDRHSTASPAVSATKDSMPGAFPSDANSHIVATPTGGSTLSEQAAADPFALNKEPVRSRTTKDDFDATFAGFGTSAKTQERTNTGSSAEGSISSVPTTFHKEFPPIAELENDDDSDSASERGVFRGGFEDDFAPASPSQGRKASTSHMPTISNTTSGDGANDFLAVRPVISQNASARSLGTNPPTPNAQNSPPAYDKTISPSEQAHSDLQQFSGLIPSREIPETSSPRTSPKPASAIANQTPFGAPQVSAQPVPPAKVPFDDDFDDFEDLEDAKEGDADDDFANISAHDRSGIDDFNPMFDSPPEPKSTELPKTATTSFGGSSAFGEYTQSPQTTHPTISTNSSNILGDEQNWDAIFAGLDSPSTEAATVLDSAKPIGNDNGSTLSAEPERPQIGRALTDAGVHDDPLLKNLTGMGYARTEALAALEKYDYNLERAANYLASSS